MLLRNCLYAAAILAAAPADLCAQTSVADIVGFLMTNQAVSTEDFERDRAAAETARDTLTRALLVSLTSMPIGTSSGGFVYRLNPELGTVERATESFGGFFVERVLTPGRGRAAFGVTASTTAFERLDGQDLRDGSFLTIANAFRDELAPFDTETLTLRIRSSTMTVFASVGVSERLEVGAAVPLVRLTLEGERINVYYGRTFQQASASASASGVGDAALRAKYMLIASRAGGFAIAGEARLPTGDADNLLGAGSAAVRLTGIGSFEQGRLSLHGNAGIVRGGVTDEFTGGGAASLAILPQLTVTGEVSGRYLSELRTLTLTSAPHPRSLGVDTLRLTAAQSGRTIADGIAGVKWNPAGTLVLAAHLRWHMTPAGLTAPLTPSIGIEYAF